MKSFYLEKIEKLDKSYEGRFNRIIEELKGGAEDAHKLREDLKTGEISFLLEESRKAIIDMRKDYIEKYREILKENMPIPKDTVYSELDLRLMKLNMLAKSDEDNKQELKEILNERDFNLHKGQLIEIAIERSDGDLYKEFTGIKKSDENYFREQTQANTSNRVLNTNYIPGMQYATQLAMSKDGISKYLERIAGVYDDTSFESYLGKVSSEEAKKIDMFN